MLTIIYFTTIVALLTLLTGFLEIKIPFTKNQQKKGIRKISFNTARKIIKRKMGYEQLHKGFINIYKPHRHHTAA